MFRPRGRHVTGEASVLDARVADPAAEDAALAHIVELVVPRLADVCSVHLFDGNGGARCAATAAADGVDGRLARRLTALLRRERDLKSLERAMAARSVVVVPLALDGRTDGVMTAATLRSDRSPVSDDLAFLRQLGHQAALALENLRLRATLEQFRAVVRRAEHDLRNPLAVISMHAELAQLRAASLDTPESVELDLSMARIRDAVARARRLADELNSQSGRSA
jgi:GAF domain-containing protein